MSNDSNFPAVSEKPVELDPGANPAHDEKAQQIKRACEERDRDRLIELAISEGGLLQDELRKEAWPILLGFNPSEVLSDPARKPWSELPKHKDEDQVRLDVQRAFVNYPINVSPKAEEELRQQLQDLIAEVLRRHPMLNYFQGFHDISQLLLLALSPKLAAPATEYLSLTYLRDFMLPTLHPALVHLELIPHLLYSADPDLARILKDIKPFFALSATLTMYAHEVRDYSHATRIFDAVLARGTAFSVYLFVGVLQARKTEVLELVEELGEGSGGEEVLGAVLGRWKGEKVGNLEMWIQGADDLWKKAPIRSLPPYKRVPACSVLRVKGSSLEEGRRLFLEQEKQVRRQKQLHDIKLRAFKLWTDKRVKTAIAIGALAIALGVWQGKTNGRLGQEMWRFVIGFAK